jgi:hypothetical protein
MQIIVTLNGTIKLKEVPFKYYKPRLDPRIIYTLPDLAVFLMEKRKWSPDQIEKYMDRLSAGEEVPQP